MVGREKVIYSIERCICHVPDACRDCSYYNEPYPPCSEHLLRDALSLLKAQEPRVMTLEEVKQAKGRDVWLELSGNIAEDVITAATIEGCGTGGICTRYESLNYAQYCVKPYGWRCWTSRPTDKQREATPWPEPPKEG